MNISLVQLKYITVVAVYQSFSKAAKHCNVTQPTLSLQIKKMEQTLGVTLFDRTTTPPTVTPIGEKIITQAKKVLGEANMIDQIIGQNNKTISGDYRIGIIPTIAPYLVPIFLGPFLRKYPKIKLKIVEQKTESLLEDIKKHTIDAAILATPLAKEGYAELPLYYEKFICYLDNELAKNDNNRVSVEKILENKVWILSEGNCFRDQTFNLCNLNQRHYRDFTFEYESGSIESLIKLVDIEGGSTIIPELATIDFSEDRLDKLRFIGETSPVREVSIVFDQRSPKKILMSKLQELIRSVLPNQIRENVDDYLVNL